MKARLYLLPILIALLPALASAEQIHVLIKTELTPSAALGLVMSPDGSASKHEASLTKLPEGIYQVAFDAQAGRGAMVTAMIESTEGRYVFGSVYPISSPDPIEAQLQTPQCPQPPPPTNTNPEQLGLILKLVEVRSARRELTQIRIAKIMDGAFLTKLQKLEKGFGLEGERVLSPTLNSMELLNRLSMLAVAVKNYEMNKEREVR